MNTLLRDGDKLPTNQFIEVRFETFEQQPLQELERIYTQLELGGFELTKPRFEHYLDKIKSYKKNAYDSKDAGLVEQHWPEFIKRWNYSSPQSG